MQPPKSQKDNDLQNTTQKDRPTRTPLKQVVNLGSLERLIVPAPLVTPVVILLNDTNII
jgi:hypothetical protein